MLSGSSGLHFLKSQHSTSTYELEASPVPQKELIQNDQENERASSGSRFLKSRRNVEPNEVTVGQEKFTTDGKQLDGNASTPGLCFLKSQLTAETKKLAEDLLVKDSGQTVQDTDLNVQPETRFLRSRQIIHSDDAALGNRDNLIKDFVHNLDKGLQPKPPPRKHISTELHNE